MFMRKSLLLVIIACSAIATLVAVPFSGAQDATKKTLRVNGAGMASAQVQKWADSFMQANPDRNVLVVGSSAGAGFQALLDKNAELALMSRPISEEEQKKAGEKGIKLAEKLVGHAGVALITHPKNPIDELTPEQLKKIFVGEYTNWKQVGGPDAPIRAITRRVPESGGAVFFQEFVLNKQPYGPATVMTESWSTIQKACAAATDLPIGLAPANGVDKSIKVLAIKKDEDSPGVRPSEETLRDGRYPIILSLRFLWDSQSQDDHLKRFVDYCAQQGLGASPGSEK
jgi:phosphate transport system substrate-binding protein